MTKEEVLRMIMDSANALLNKIECSTDEETAERVRAALQHSCDEAYQYGLLPTPHVVKHKLDATTRTMDIEIVERPRVETIKVRFGYETEV